jgi:hypothetical protein
MKQRTAIALLFRSAVIIAFVLVIAGVVIPQESSAKLAATPSTTVTPSRLAATPSLNNGMPAAHSEATSTPKPPRSWLESVGFLVAVLALILGVIHLHGIRAQARDIRAQASDIRSQAQLSESHSRTLEAILNIQSKQSQISESHSRTLEEILNTQTTHHIGQFPEYIATIADFIESATMRVEVLCDIPGYGSFSAPHDYLRYRQAIEKKIDEHVPVKMTCLQPQLRVDLIHEQFSKNGPESDEWKKEHREGLEMLLRLQLKGGGITVESITVLQLVSLLIENLRMLDGAFTGVEFSLTGEYIPLYFWLVDGTDPTKAKAVFAIPSFSERGTEHGFSTLDPHLIAAFRDLRARYERAGLHEGSAFEN